jgi:hypothetical protein
MADACVGYQGDGALNVRRSAAALLAALALAAPVALSVPAPAGATTIKARLTALHKEIHRLQGLSVKRGYALGMIIKHGNGGKNSKSIAYLRWVHTFWAKRAFTYRQAVAKRHPVYTVLTCIHQHEGAWNAYNSAGPYYGGLQMSPTFQVHWGNPALKKWGDARHWPAGMQLAVGYRAVQQLGYSPWVSSAAACGH